MKRYAAIYLALALSACQAMRLPLVCRGAGAPDPSAIVHTVEEEFPGEFDAARIHYKLMQRFLAELDHSGASRIEPRERLVPVGLGVIHRNGAPVVSHILPFSSLYEQDVRNGDQIIEVGNETVSACSPIETLEAMARAIRESSNESSPATTSTTERRLRGAAVTLRRTEGTPIHECVVPSEQPAGVSTVRNIGTRIVYLHPYMMTDEHLDTIVGGKLPITSSTIGVILDLRDCPGGGIAEACKLCGLFMKGEVCRSRDAGGREERYVAAAAPQRTDLPLVVLVNLGTGRGAEITAAALQDAGRALVLGSRTPGWGYQHTKHKIGGTEVIHPVRALLSPGGRELAGGVAPDIDVEIPDTSADEWRDFRRQMEHFLRNEPDPDVEKALEERRKEEQKREKRDGKKHKKAVRSPEETALDHYPLLKEVDIQLYRALNLLVSANIFFSHSRR